MCYHCSVDYTQLGHMTAYVNCVLRVKSAFQFQISGVKLQIQVYAVTLDGIYGSL